MGLYSWQISVFSPFKLRTSWQRSLLLERKVRLPRNILKKLQMDRPWMALSLSWDLLKPRKILSLGYSNRIAKY